MSRMKLVLDVVADMRALADSLQALADAVSGDADETAGKQESVPDSECSKTMADEVEEKRNSTKEKAYSLTEVRALLAEKSRAGYTSKVRELLGKYGAVKLSEIRPEDYAALAADAEVLGNE